MKKAIGYTRISDEDQSRWSLTGQAAMISEHCEKNNWQLIATFSDDGQSARNFDRADWKQLEAFVKNNHHAVDYLLVVAWTRFSRRTKEALDMIEMLENRYHIRIISITEPLAMHPDSPYYHYIRQQIIQNAELEWRMIRDRTLFGIHTAQKAGRYITAPPRGYIRSKDKAGGPTIEIDPLNAPFIKEAFARFLNGETFVAIRSILKQKGFIIRGNSDLQRMLRHPAYMGYVKQIAYYDAPETLVKGIHPAIITEDDWWKAQAIFAAKNKIKRATISEDFPLRGVLKCFCQRNLTAAFSRGRNGMHGYYKCNSHTGTNISAKKIHSQFNQVLDELSLPDIHIKYLREKVKENISKELDDRSSRSQTLRQQMQGIEKKISSLEEKYIDNDIEKETYYRWKRNLHNEKSALADQLASYQQPVDEIWRRFETSMNRLGMLQYVYRAATVEEKHGFIRQVFDNQLYYQDNVYRTGYLLELFHPKALTLKEKGLLIYEPHPSISPDLSLSAPHRSIIEPLTSFLTLISSIKVA